MLAAGSPLDPFYTVLGWLLAFYYQPFHSLGLAIILLTFTVMLVQFPLIAKQTRSMIQMQRVQPEIKKLQQKHKDDRQKLNEELMKFYQENKINPLAGCLPLLIIIPIGMAVFRLFYVGVQKHIPKTGTFSRLYEDLCKGNLKDATACGKAFDPKHPPGALKFFGINLNLSATEAQHKLDGILHWWPYYLLVAFVVLTGWYQVRQTQARQLRQGTAAPNAQMQVLTRIMPVFFGFITLGLNAATTLYFVVSNVWRIGQQQLVLNKMYDEAVATGEIKPTGPAKTPPARGPAGGKGGDGRAPGGPTSKSTGRTGQNGENGRGGNRPGQAARRKRKRKR